MADDRIIQKIEKCLRLAQSGNANEAATALRHAQALMREHGLTEADIDAAAIGNAVVDVPIQRTVEAKVPVILDALCDVVVAAFGVTCTFGSRIGVSDLSWTVRYWGPGSRAKLASYAHTVMWRACNAAWTQHLKERPWVRGERGVRTSFMLGWLGAVHEKVQAIGFTESEIKSMELARTKFYGRELTKAVINELNDLDDTALGAGITAAQDFSIHRPMEESGQKKLGHDK